MKTIESVAAYLRSKFFSLVLFALVVLAYTALPDGMPFTELAYTVVTVMGVVVMGPIIRLVVFNEAAAYAEGPQLQIDLHMHTPSPALLHYWFATALSYAAPIVCIATISK